jgi:hypothetical protein
MSLFVATFYGGINGALLYYYFAEQHIGMHLKDLKH